jgi:hypothetical protein
MNNFNGWLGDHQSQSCNGYTFYTRAHDEKNTDQNSGVRDAIGNVGKKDSYYGVIDEIWELEYGLLKIPLFRCQWVNRAGGGMTTDRYGMTIVDFKKIGYKDEPFILANDVTQVFYVKDMSSKPKKDMSSRSKNDELKRHIVLLGKRKIIGVEDISQKLEDFDQFDDLPSFSVNIDPSILLSKEDAPCLRRDPNHGTFIK